MTRGEAACDAAENGILDGFRGTLHSRLDGNSHIRLQKLCTAGALKHMVKVRQPGVLLHAIQWITVVCYIVHFQTNGMAQLGPTSALCVALGSEEDLRRVGRMQS